MTHTFSINDVLGLASLIVGLCSDRFVTAFRWTVLIGSVWAAIIAVLLIFSPEVQFTPHVAGQVIGIVVGAALIGLLGHAIRRGFAAFFRLFRKSNEA